MSEKYVFGSLNSGTGILTATDYTSELGRIATALEAFVSLADQMNTSLNAINSSLNIVADKISSIELLASGNEGIHTVGPYDWLTGADLYNWYALGNRPLPIDPVTLSSLTNYVSTASYISTYFPKFQ